MTGSTTASAEEEEGSLIITMKDLHTVYLYSTRTV